MRDGPAAPKVPKPPSAEIVAPPTPQKAFKPKVPKFTPPGVKDISGATSGTIT